MLTLFRTVSAVVCVLILLGPENQCAVHDLWSQLRLHLFGVRTYVFWDGSDSHQCDITRTGPERVGASGWYTFLLLRSSGVLLLLGSTALITRNGSTTKVLSGLADRLAVVLRIFLHLALSLDLLLPHWTGTWAGVPAAAADIPAGPALYSPQHLITGTFLLNQVLFFSQNPFSELCAGVIELLLLCCNLVLLHTNSSSGSTGTVSVNSFCSSSARCSGSGAYSHLAATPLTQWHANSSSSSSSSNSLAKLLLIAVLSRLLLPLLASRAHLLLSCSSSSRTTQSASASRSRGSQGHAHLEAPSAAAAAPSAAAVAAAAAAL